MGEKLFVNFQYRRVLRGQVRLNKTRLGGKHPDSHHAKGRSAQALYRPSGSEDVALSALHAEARLRRAPREPGTASADC